MTAIRTYYASLVALTVLEVLVPLARFYMTRHKRRDKRDIAADILLVFTAASACWQTIYFATVCHKQMDLENSGLSHSELYAALITQGTLKVIFVLGLDYIFYLYAIKVAFYLFYWKLFDRVPSVRKTYLHIVGSFLPCLCIVCVLVHTLICYPTSRNWNGNLECVANYKLAPQTVIMITNIFTDILLFLLPVQILRALRLEKRDTAAISLVFIIATISVAVTVIRFSLLVSSNILSSSSALTILPTENVANVVYRDAILTSTEALGAMLAYTLLAMRPLLDSVINFYKKTKLVEIIWPWHWKPKVKQVAPGVYQYTRKRREYRPDPGIEITVTVDRSYEDRGEIEEERLDWFSDLEDYDYMRRCQSPTGGKGRFETHESQALR